MDPGRSSKVLHEDRDLLSTANNIGPNANSSTAGGGTGPGAAALNTASSASLRVSRHALSLAAPSPVASMANVLKSAASVSAAYLLGSGSKATGAASTAGRRESSTAVPAENLFVGLARRFDSLLLPMSIGGSTHTDMPHWEAAAREGGRGRQIQISGAASFVGRLGAGVVQRLANTSKKVMGPSAAVLDFPIAFRGFRVRCGMHSGLLESRDVFWTKVSGRRAYSGPAMALAKTVSDLVPGGMVILTDATFQQLQPWPNPEVLPGAIIWCRGRFRVRLGEGGGAGAAPSAEVDLFQLLCPQLLARQPHLERRPWRGAQQVLPGVLSAPLGQLALVLVQVVGVQVLASWDSDVTAAALQVFGSVAVDVLAAWGGFPASVDTTSGTMLAAFREPALALGYMHALIDVLRDADWPAELLQHELGEPLAVPLPQQGCGTGGTVTPTGGAAECQPSPLRRGGSTSTSGTPLAFRGLRVRCVADVASIRVDLGCATAASLYETRDHKAFKALRRMLGLAHMGSVGGVYGNAAVGLYGGVMPHSNSGTVSVHSSAAQGAPE
ncbi:hypothetical protein GPECTOR_6g662 [Gonium pectorale]|uniref:Guanylate cyclase domain-containing protein n=1 Tax=Gonium pectorale TaxID=33097 RepID=A0A150GV50_GONPE|nr:hypothetical protein GPECTOR_6g662 [Gonium pectorale]|eukprot:KXZ53745.1 hypothetical protein GPECTOR_6g662 [Gonium pectorale]